MRTVALVAVIPFLAPMFRPTVVIQQPPSAADAEAAGAQALRNGEVIRTAAREMGAGRSSWCEMEQHPATLAVDCIGLVLGKAARGTLVVHSARAEQHLHHSHKQTDTDNHHHDAEQSARLPESVMSPNSVVVSAVK